MQTKMMTNDVAEIVAQKHNGKDIAFAPCSLGDVAPGLFGLGIVVKDEPGYDPLSHNIAHGPEMAMHQNAAILNDKVLRLTKDQAFMYVASSMRSVR